jgi:hypothetical protein
MTWYNYLAIFFSGVFLANSVPHFVAGVSGNKFPTPFSKPPGRGLSSAPTNTFWGLLNMVIGYVLYRVGKMNGTDITSLVLFFAGVASISIMCSYNFQKKHRE